MITLYLTIKNRCTTSTSELKSGTLLRSLTQGLRDNLSYCDHFSCQWIFDTCYVADTGQISLLPRHLVGLVKMLGEYQALAAEAAWTGTRRDAIRALASHPLVFSLPLAETSYDEMAAHRQYLPGRLLRLASQNVELIIVEDYEALSRAGADWLIEAMREQPDAAIVAATGDTPMGMYIELAQRRFRGLIDTSWLRVFQLDAYLGLPPDDNRALFRWTRRLKNRSP